MAGERGAAKAVPGGSHRIVIFWVGLAISEKLSTRGLISYFRTPDLGSVTMVFFNTSKTAAVS